MGWVLFWVSLALVLALMWFWPNLRRRPPEHLRPGDRVGGNREDVVREATRTSGMLSGWRGFGGWGGRAD